MYWRCVQPIVEFLKSPDIEEGAYILDTQFGKINYVARIFSRDKYKNQCKQLIFCNRNNER